ncbi:hypothetical protein [Nocardia sp. NPDC052566]|uniref:hypothetical protein n=1 Tax=Nocardia sp. NPDC052566 TaxID=3364330 RepID=UPI0037CB2688
MASDDTDNDATPKTAAAPAGRRISIRVSTIVTAVAMAALLIATITFAALYFTTRADLTGRDDRAADDAHAEQVAMDYAVGGSTIDYRDIKGWVARLKTNTTPELAAKFDATTSSYEQIVAPLQWVSKATPIKAVVMSESGGVYKVDAFLDTEVTNLQTPQGGRVTLNYEVTVDKNRGWKITEAGGGLYGALSGK